MDHHEPKNKSVAPEEIIIGAVYSLTINPSDHYQFWHNKTRLDVFKQWFRVFLLRLRPAEVKGYIELSQLGRLHFHGTIIFSSYATVNKFYIDNIRQLVEHTIYEMDTTTNDNEWLTYCTKGKNVLSEYIDNLKIDLREKLNENLDVVIPPQDIMKMLMPSDKVKKTKIKNSK